MSEQGNETVPGGERRPDALAGSSGVPESDAGKKVKDERMWAMFTHLSALAALTGVPLLNIAGPLIIWQVKKADMPSIEPHGKEAVNFQISVAIYFFSLIVIGTLLMVILIGVFFFLAAGAVALAAIIFTIIAGLKANEGVLYKYPFTIRILK